MKNKIGVCIFIALLFLGALSQAQAEIVRYEYVDSFTKESIGLRLFSPENIVADEQGNLYITTSMELLKLDSKGKLLKRFFADARNRPASLAIDKLGNLYFYIRDECVITRYNPEDGSFACVKKSLEGLRCPASWAVDSKGNIYVVDRFCSDFRNADGRIVKLDSQGNFITQWYGEDSGKALGRPHTIAVDSQDNVYVVDTRNYRIVKFTPEGKYLTQWSSTSFEAIAIDRNDDVYVTSFGSPAIKKFDAEGNYLIGWGRTGDGIRDEPGEFWRARFGITIDKFGNVYIADTGNNRIQKFRPIWRFVRGDANGDGAVDIGDAVTVLGILFAGQSPNQSLDAADVDDDGTLTIADAISILNYLYVGGPTPRAPFPEPGEDTTPDELN